MTPDLDLSAVTQFYQLETSKHALTGALYFDNILPAATTAEELKARHDAGEEMEEFDIRCELYYWANLLGKKARKQDWKTTKRWLRPSLGEIGADMAAGTGVISFPLAEATRATVYAIDPSRGQLGFLEKEKAEKGETAALVEPIVARPDAIDFIDKVSCNNNIQLAGSLDYVTSFGGIHHMGDQETFFRNVAAILKPGGRFTAADVGAATPLAKYFDDVVSKDCLIGHHGNWLSEEKLAKLCEGLPLVVNRTKIMSIVWKFRDALTASLFFVGLHAYTKCRPMEVVDGLEKYLREDQPRRVHRYNVNWPMLYWDITRTDGEVPNAP